MLKNPGFFHVLLKVCPFKGAAKLSTKIIVRHKNRRKHNILNCFFSHKKFTLCNIKPNLPYRKLNLPLASSIYLDILLLEMQTRLLQTKVYHTFFLFCLKKDDPQTFKSSSCKSSFLQYVYILLLQFVSMNVFCSMWWKILLFIKIRCYSETFLIPMFLRSSKPMFWKKFIFYALSPQ